MTALIARVYPSMAASARHVAVRLTAIVEGLAYYVLIGACELVEAQERLAAELAAVLD